MTPAAVDSAVRAFWVDGVLRQHAALDEDACWAAFLASPYGRHIPTATWPSSPWTAARVQAALSSMREGASAGMAGIPIAVWRALPLCWASAVARLLALIEAEGRWPHEWLDAYVTMIPKASGGSRPQDQRPITVLDVLYRLWAKGVVQEWGPTLQRELLGCNAFGFRSGLGTLHAAQVLEDLVHLRRKEGAELWLASFDVAKCFDSLPWWAVFRTLLAVGIRPAVVTGFQAFYRQVRRRFRYGAVDGSVWFAANGLAQGCPASPDLLNILMEAFHRWAVSEGLGVPVAGLRIASVSFADDVALVAGSQLEMERLILAYLQWCSLLGVKVTKAQVWSSSGPGQRIQAGDLEALTAPNFKFVGVVLGLPEPLASQAHLGPRLAKALATTQRLRALQLPASLCGLLWRSTVLPQALYGCQIRDLRPQALAPLAQAGQAAVVHKAPLQLNTWRAPEVARGLPMGQSAVGDPVESMRFLQLSWLQLLGNSPSLAGVVHRAVASSGPVWREPSSVIALCAALQSVGWRVRLRSSTRPGCS